MSKEITEADFVNLANDCVGIGLLPTGNRNYALAKSYAKQQSIEFAEWMQRYALYDYSKHPYKYCAGQQPNGGRGKIETWTAEQLYNLFLQQTENQQTQGE
jgi:hypothetical protein